MKELSVSVIVLVILVFVMAFSLIPLTQGPIIVKEEGKLSYVQEKIVDKAAEALERGDYETAAKLLKPMKKYPDPRMQLVYLESEARLGNYYASKTAMIARKVKETKRIELIWGLAQLYEGAAQFSLAHQVYREMTDGELPTRLRLKIYLRFGSVSLLMKKFPDAIRAFKVVIEEDPTREEAFVELFKLLPQENRFGEIAELRKAGDRHHQKKFAYNFWLGKAYYDEKEYHEASNCFMNCAKAKPKNPLTRYYLVQLFRKGKKIRESLIQLGKLLETDEPLPLDVDLSAIMFECSIEAMSINRLDLASQFLRPALFSDLSLLGGDDKGVIDAARDHVMADGTLEEKKFMPVFMTYLNGDYEGAKQRMVKLLPTLENSLLKRDGERLVKECQRIIDSDNKYYARIARLEAAEEARRKNALSKNTRVAKTASESKALSQDDGDPDEEPAQLPSKPIMVTNNVTVSSPLVAMPRKREPQKGELKPGELKQIEEIKEKADQSPESASKQYMAGVKLLRFKQNAEAKAYLENAVAIDPNLAEASYRLAQLYREEGNAQATVTNLESAIKANPQNSVYKSVMASVLFETGDAGMAIEFAQAAVKADPNNSEGYYVMAQVQYQSQRPKEALDSIGKGLAVEKAAPTSLKRSLEALKSQLEAETQ